MRVAFNREWARSEPLDQRFIDRYVEAARRPPDAAVHRRARGAKPRAAHRAKNELLMFGIADWIEERSVIARRVEQLLRGIDAEWSRVYPAAARSARDGDYALLVSRPDRKVCLVRMVDDAQTDGSATVLAYETLVEGVWNEATRTALAGIGIAISKRGGRLPLSRWVAVPWSSVEQALRQG